MFVETSPRCKPWKARHLAAAILALSRQRRRRHDWPGHDDFQECKLQQLQLLALSAFAMQDTIPASESLTVEFESDRARLSDWDLVEAIVCLANCDGGQVWFGVEDDGTQPACIQSIRTLPDWEGWWLLVPPLPSRFKSRA